VKLALIIKMFRRAGVKIVQILRPIEYVPVKIVCFQCGLLMRTELWPKPVWKDTSHGLCPKCYELLKPTKGVS